ncbi:MAG TPA: hypothetical protein V6D47_05920 [Oscillatoriaceae cyanobacterium]
MAMLQDVQDTVSGWLGRKPETPMDRLTRTMRNLPSLPMPRNPGLDATSMLLGAVLGCGIGIALGWMLQSAMQPAIEAVREEAEEALERAESALPTRLNVTRLQ